MKINRQLFLMAAIFQFSLLFAQVTEEWVARYNGVDSLDDGGNAITVDGDGNVYVAGFINLFQEYVTIKYDANGDTAWVRKFRANPAFGGHARAIAVDDGGNVYVTGNAVLLSTQSQDIYTIKYNSDGDSLWTQRFNGMTSDLDVGNAITVDDSQNVYVTGTTQVGTQNNGRNYVTIKYSTDGIERWAAIYNGPANFWDEAYSIAVDDTGYIYVTGMSRTGLGVPDGDWATIKYTPDGDSVWVRRYDGPGSAQDEAYAIAVDGSGILVTGRSGASSDYLTIKYGAAGDTVFVARYDGGNHDAAYSLRVDDSDNFYVTGSSNAGTGQMNDYLTIKYNSSGDTVWTARYDGPSSETDDATSLEIDAEGNVYVTGRSQQPATGVWDYLTVKYDSEGVEQWVARYNGPANDNDEASNVFNSSTLRGNSSIALDGSGNVYVTGRSKGVSTSYDIATIKYSQQPIGIRATSNIIPEEFYISQNYPNPFNPTTTIEFNIPQSSKVKLIIYDIMGREIALLVNKQLNAGSYEVEWDAGNFSSGVYLFQIQAEQFAATRKMILLK